MQKGQYIRLLVSVAANPSTVVAAAKQMALHGSAQTEDSTTKDTTGTDLEYEVTGQSYDITGSGLVLTPNDTLLTGAVGLNDFENWIKDQLLNWKICVMSGTNNRTVEEVICQGQCKCTNLKMDAQNQQVATYNYTLNGYGAISVGAGE